MDDRWVALYQDILRGDRPFSDPELARLSEALALDHPRTHDRRPPLPAPAMELDALTNVTEDHLPDLVSLAIDRVLGPWADEAPSRALQRLALEVMAFTPVMREGITPAIDRLTRKPIPSDAEREALRATLRAPPMIWRVAADGSWEPLLPLAPHFAPEGPVAGPVIPLPGVATPAFVIGRAWPAKEGGWFCPRALGLGSAPPRGAIERRMRLEMGRIRRHERRSTWEDLLRRRSEVLYRTCAIWDWLQRAAEEPCC